MRCGALAATIRALGVNNHFVVDEGCLAA